MVASCPLSKFDGETFDDPTLFRSTVGALQYLSLTRPDVVFAVNLVWQFMYRPTHTHQAAVKHILCYLKHMISHGLLLQKSHSVQLVAFSNADWAGCPNDHRSTTGYCVQLNILDVPKATHSATIEHGSRVLCPCKRHR